MYLRIDCVQSIVRQGLRVGWVRFEDGCHGMTHVLHIFPLTSSPNFAHRMNKSPVQNIRFVSQIFSGVNRIGIFDS